ncbi:2-hydroxyacid dehydrogenase [Streptomyces sp. NPDC088400]|uniref:2-hydroxyacid dehydrogenase n=1 Tax=Streptomyces sp. NPDC088400 TaxID=3365861 RepID=UPI0038080ADB
MAQRVLTTRPMLPGGGLDRLGAAVDLVRPPGPGKPAPETLHELAAGVDGILCLGNDSVDAALLDAAGPSLKVVSLASMGFDGVDQQAAADRGIVITHTPGVLAETTADLAFGLLLMARRRLGTARDSLLGGEWQAFDMGGHLGLDVYGATLGIIGYGAIGQAVARRGKGFGMRVLHHSRSTAPDGTGDIAPDENGSVAVDLPTLLAESDIISLHVPLSPATRNLIGAAELRAMKPTATLVNTARGGVVDEDALLEALDAGTLHSAGLDVFAREPMGPEPTALARHPRVVPLPHIGSATESTRAHMVDLAADNILDVLGGNPARTAIPGSSPVPRKDPA